MQLILDKTLCVFLAKNIKLISEIFSCKYLKLA